MSLKQTFRKNLQRLMITGSLSFLLSLIFGCQINSFHSKSPDLSVEELLKQHMYQAAFDKAPASQKKSIEKASDAYSQATIDHALDMLNEDQWKEAIETLTFARQGSLKKANIDKTILRIEKDEYVELARARTLEAIRKANWFNSQQDLYEMYLLSTHASVWHRARLKNLYKQQSELVEELLKFGKIMLREGDTALAQRTYSVIGTLWMEENLFDAYDDFAKSIAHQLNKNDLVKNTDVKDEKNTLQEKADSNLPQEVEVRIDQRTTEKKALFKQLDQATQRADLVKINNLLGQLYSEKNLTRRDQISIDRTENYLKAQTELLDQQAEQLYGEGYLSAAYGIWSVLLRVEPNNVEWQTKLTRARRVMSNLEELREESGPAVE